MQIAAHSPEALADEAEARFREVFRGLHDGHATCVDDEWLDLPCRATGGAPTHPVVWSRRNGPWRRVPLLFVGAAPGNAGGMGRGDMGAHGTRIPFGGDVAGANLDLLLESVDLSRADVFLAAALNRLPDAGGGEPTIAELARPAGAFRDSVAALGATILASGAAVVVALGNVALRASLGALARPRADGAPLRLPGLARMRAAGIQRNRLHSWPATPGSGTPSVEPAFVSAWRKAWDAPLPRILWLLHPSAQNMSPHAGTETGFHARMVETRAALRAAAADPSVRMRLAGDGADATSPRGTARRRTVYDTPEWRERVGPRHEVLLSLWREKGLGSSVRISHEVRA